MLRVYQFWTSGSNHLLSPAVANGLEMGHFGGGTNFKIAGNQLPRVPDDEVKESSKKSLTSAPPPHPPKKKSICILRNSLHESRIVLRVISRMHLATGMVPKFGAKKLHIAHP